MGDSVEDIDGDIMLKFRKFLVEEDEMILLSMAHGILTGLAWRFLTLLAVGAALLRYFLPPGITWFKVHECYNKLTCFFTITDFNLVVHVLEKAGRKFFF